MSRGTYVVPKNVIDLLDNLQNEFIWSGKKAKIKHSTLIGDFNQGGLKKVDIVTKIQSLQLSWIRRLLDDNFHPCKSSLLYYCLMPFKTVTVSFF